MQPKVSVVIPCYNHAIYLSEAVASVMAQTYDNWECLIINDGSPDHTETIGKQLANSDPRIHYHYKPNGGLSNARNFGIEKAKGEFILTLDADDTFEPVFLQEAVAILEDNKTVGIVTCNGYRHQNQKIINSFTSIGGGLENYLFQNAALASSLFRKLAWEQVNGYDETMNKGYEDWDFFLRVSANNWETHVIDKPLFWYRQHPNSMLKLAQNKYDLEIKQYFYSKHETIYKKYFPEMVSNFLNQIDHLKKQEQKRIQSIDFKLGNALLQPFRFLKKIVS